MTHFCKALFVLATIGIILVSALADQGVVSRICRGPQWAASRALIDLNTCEGGLVCEAESFETDGEDSLPDAPAIGAHPREPLAFFGRTTSDACTSAAAPRTTVVIEVGLARGPPALITRTFA